jgi:hypothetical protein
MEASCGLDRLPTRNSAGARGNYWLALLRRRRRRRSDLHTEAFSCVHALGASHTKIHSFLIEAENCSNHLDHTRGSRESPRTAAARHRFPALR